MLDLIFFYYVADDMTVHKSMRIKVPKNLVIDSANLQLDEPVGQGTYIYNFFV